MEEGDASTTVVCTNSDRWEIRDRAIDSLERNMTAERVQVRDIPSTAYWVKSRGASGRGKYKEKRGGDG